MPSWSSEIARRFLNRYEDTPDPSERATELYQALRFRLDDDPESFWEEETLRLAIELEIELRAERGEDSG